MSEVDLSTLFVRFRDVGDVSALAEVFDRCAPDLLDLAHHLTRRGRLLGVEEDLVQQTFLTAIERRESYDASRPLEPWLAGILANHAAHARRSAARRSQESPAVESSSITERDGVREAFDREIRSEVTHAVSRLPEHYRSLVEDRLFDEQRSREIAVRHGRTPSVVRSQLHRGLLYLRRVLPPGLLASLAAYGIARGLLRDGRQRIVAEAAHLGGPVVTASTGLSAGGLLLMSKPIVLAACALVLLIVGFALLRPNAAPLTGDPGAQPLVSAPPSPPVVASTTVEPATRVTESNANAVSTIPAKEDAAPPESYLRALCGVRGRLLEADGSPTANTAIALLAWDRGYLTSSLTMTSFPESPLPEAARTATDSDGRFTLERIEPTCIHALTVDPGGPKSTLKVLDIPLVSGSIIDLGDITLGALSGLSGHILDEDGSPVANARVRIVPNMPIVLGTTTERVTPSTSVLVEHSGEAHVESLPIWMRLLLPHLPFPTAHSRSDGSFEVPGAASGSMVVWVDRDGFVPAMFGPVSLRDGKPHDIGALTLEWGRRIAGRIVDGDAHPMSGIELTLGATGPVPGLTFLTLATTTDAAGHFAFDHVPEAGEPRIAARSSRASHWYVLPTPPATAEGLELVLPIVATHEIHLRREDQQPIGAVSLRVAPDTSRDGRTPFERDDTWETPEFTREASDRITLHALLPGSYRALLSVEGCGTTALYLEVAANAVAQEVVLPTPRALELRIIDRDTEAPIEHASVALFSPNDTMLEIAEGRSDAEGRARLSPVSLANSDRVHVRVAHPAYAPLRTDVETLPGEPATLRLAHGGSIEGRFVNERSPPPDRMLLVLMPTGRGSALALPTFISANARGEFAAAGLAPDRYDWMAYPNHLAADWRTLSSRVSRDIRFLEAEPEQRGRVEIESGQTAHLEIEITPRGSARNGRIRGRVTSHGAAVLDARLHASTGRDRVQHPVDANGYYELEDVRPGSVVISLYCGSFETPEGIHTLVARTIDLAAGSTATVDFQVAEREMSLRVTDRGAPVAGVEVELQPTTDEQESRWFHPRKTDLAGEVRLAANEPGRYRVAVDEPTRGYAVSEITIPCSQPNPTIELDPGITFAGRIEIDPAIGKIGDCYSLLAEVVVSNAPFHRQVEIDTQKGTFRIEHLPRGRVVFSLPGGPAKAEAISLDLDISDEAAVLHFRP